MLKYLILFLFFIYSFIAIADDISQIRNMYTSSIETEKKCEDFGKHMLNLNYDEKQFVSGILGLLLFY